MTPPLNACWRCRKSALRVRICNNTSYRDHAFSAQASGAGLTARLDSSFGYLRRTVRISCRAQLIDMAPSRTTDRFSTFDGQGAMASHVPTLLCRDTLREASRRSSRSCWVRLPGPTLHFRRLLVALYYVESRETLRPDMMQPALIMLCTALQARAAADSPTRPSSRNALPIRTATLPPALPMTSR
jgi:hypothetical protein